MAVGTKSGKDMCFAVSAVPLTMEEWAGELQKKGYKDALNLDGGPYSQLGIRENGTLQIHGYGGNKKEPTTSVLMHAKQ